LAWGNGGNASKLLSGFSGMKLQKTSVVFTIFGWCYDFGDFNPESSEGQIVRLCPKCM